MPIALQKTPDKAESWSVAGLETEAMPAEELGMKGDLRLGYCGRDLGLRGERDLGLREERDLRKIRLDGAGGGAKEKSKGVTYRAPEHSHLNFGLCGHDFGQGGGRPGGKGTSSC